MMVAVQMTLEGTRVKRGSHSCMSRDFEFKTYLDVVEVGYW